jgi:Carboxypeptidase regulatory-like domain
VKSVKGIVTIMTKTITCTTAFCLVLGATTAAQPPRPADTSRTVTLTLTEYNRLLDLSTRSSPGAAAPPVAAVLASADLRIRADRDVVRGVFSLSGEALRPGISRVNVLGSGTLVEASAAGRPLPLVAEGQTFGALVQGPGAFAATLEWGAPLRQSPGRASFVVPVPPAGTVRATFDIPGDEADVHLSAGLVTRRSAADGRTLVEATLDPGSATEVWWSMRDSAPVAAAREARTLADVMTLVTLTDSDIRMVALIDISVVQGEPRAFDVRLPPDYEVTAVTGGSLDRSDPGQDGLVLSVTDPALRRHQFLISLERHHPGGSFSMETGVVTLPGVQRERGQIGVEGVGTLELNAAERDGMHRIDVRELDRPLQSLARLPILAAFRYQRSSSIAPGLALDVRRFTDAGVLAAVAERAVATTLVTAEGRALTEVQLTVQNRAQPFLKVNLPAGSAMVSVDVAGEPAKPVLGADGARVPLLRSGFRPDGPYNVSFVYMHAGTPFTRKGDLQMALPRMDIAVSIVEWELFVPDNYSVRTIGGNMIDRRLLLTSLNGAAAGRSPAAARIAGDAVRDHRGGLLKMSVDALPGQVVGRTTDESGASLPGVTVVLEANGTRRTAVTDRDGAFRISGVPSAQVTLSAALAGFQSEKVSFTYDQQPRHVDFEMRVSSLQETVTVSAESPDEDTRKKDRPSQNVINLQRRAAGVLPVRVEVPHAGTSHQFVKPLVVDQDAVVRMRYKRR